MKKCSKCKKKLDESSFNWKIKNKKRAAYCRNCSRMYVKKHYDNNKSYYLKKAKKWNLKYKKRVTKFLGDYFNSHPCIDCGEKDILVLEFDHKDRNNKNSNISSIIRDRLSIDKLKSEIGKCEVRCTNCHRRKTEIENNSWKLKYSASSSVD